MKLKGRRRPRRCVAVGSLAATAAFSGPAWTALTERWRPFDARQVPEWLSHRHGEAHFSDVPVFQADSVPDHVQDASWAGKPFIIRENPCLLDRQAALEKGPLVEAAMRGQLQVGVGHSWSIAQNRGAGPQKVQLADYLLHGMQKVLHDGDTPLEPAYAFDRSIKLTGLPGSADVHPVIRSWNETAFDMPGNAISLQMLGGPQSAVGWHSHGETVQMTVHGRKRWFLYPLDRYPPGDGPGGGFSLTDWLRLVYPSLKPEDKPLECIVEPGDLIHVPDGWYHAVVNLADTVAVSIQNADMAPEHQQDFKGVSLQSVQRMWQEDPASVQELAEAARAYLSKGRANDLHARRVLYYCLMELNPDEAVEVVLEGTARDPFHVPMQFELATWLDRRIKAGDESALDTFRRAMVQWEPFLVSNSRNLKALWILSKYYRAVGDEITADRYHARLVDLHERGIDR